MKLVIIIPAYNEEKFIEYVIKSMPDQIKGIDEIMTLVIDDGSKDKTAELAKTAGATVISHLHNQGLGKAFNTGLNAALELGADIMVNIDADGQFFSDDIPRLIHPILKNECDFVSGDRFIKEDGSRKKPEYMSSIKFWGNKRMADLVGFITGTSYNDVSCGFRAYSKEAMLRLNLTGKFTYTQESFLDLANKGMEIKSIPIKVKYFSERKSRVAGSIFKYMVQTAKIIFRAYRDYRPLRFFGWLGLVFVILGLILGFFVLIHYVKTAAFSPFIFIAFIAVYLFTLGIILWIIGLLADMFVRIRLNQEQMIYDEKRRRYTKK